MTTDAPAGYSISIGEFTFDVAKQLLTHTRTSRVSSPPRNRNCLSCSAATEMRYSNSNFALKSIWIDDNYFNARSMDVYITKLRKYLNKDQKVEILNIHGKGYKLLC
ncbi:MAG: winged helix-turn-helix domain-containing protein [Marinilabiliales bacterium]|nr:winged helix-turn-helix domain-containing protein [Marinilabiliales bacterium]